MSKRRREIAFLETESSRMVTFSKRRKGLFKKASELCVLSGAKVAIITFSPNGRPFVFGHDSVDQVLSRYLPAASPAEKEAMPDSGSGFVALMQWVEESIKHCETPEELHSLIQQYTHLLERVKGRIEDMESSGDASLTDTAPSMDEIFEILDQEGENQNQDNSSFCASLDDFSPSMDEIFEILDKEGENQNPDILGFCASSDHFSPSMEETFEILDIDGEKQNSPNNPMQVSDYGVQSPSVALDIGCSTSFSGLDDSSPSIDEIFESIGGENQEPVCMIQDQRPDDESWVYDFLHYSFL